MGINRLTGTPWHIEKYTRDEFDDRRHRSRCAYFQKSDAYCSRYSEKCRGSAHCPYYKEKDDGVANISEDGSDEEDAAPVFKSKKKIQKFSDRESMNLFQVGSRVIHKTYGTGTVKKVGGGKVTIAFDKGREVMLALDVCVKNELLKLVK